MKDCIGTVISNEIVCGEIHSVHGHASSHILRLNCPEIAQTAKPGQFTMLDCGPDYSLRRPLSVHSVSGDTVSFYFTAWQGHATEALASLKPGDEIALLGPLGNGFTIEDDAQNLLLVGGGMGTAPLRFLAETALAQGKNITFVTGAKTSEEQLAAEHLPHELSLHVCTDDGSAGIKGLVTDLIPDHIDSADQVFICGPLPMYRAIAARRRELLLDKPAQVSLEVRMGCGVGGCLSCSVKTMSGMRRVCKDGPVFDLDEVVWDSVKV